MEEIREKDEATSPVTSTGLSRRTLIAGAAGAAGMFALGTLAIVPAEAKVRPPGGQDEDALIGACIRCQRCVESCPKGALEPQHVEEGLLSVRTPVAMFDRGWCDFCESEAVDGPQCVKHCPTGALSLPKELAASGSLSQSMVLGKATIVREWCLAFRLIGCRYCYDACPYDAIELDQNNRPHVIADRCNGCGACQNACVSLQEGSLSEGATSRAIVVVPESQFVEQD